MLPFTGGSADDQLMMNFTSLGVAPNIIKFCVFTGDGVSDLWGSMSRIAIG
jgi:hypothetical protein